MRAQALGIGQSGDVLTIRHIAIYVACLTFFVLSSAVRGQGTAQGVASGMVVDAQKHPVQDAEVLAVDPANVVRATTMTTSDGAFTLTGLAFHTTYQFTVRKIGFSAGTVRLTTPQENDTLWFDVQLESAVQTLKSVQVTSIANPAYRIDAAEIAKHGAVDALDVVLKLKPRMLGDAYKDCRPDTSHLGAPLQPSFPSFGGTPMRGKSPFSDTTMRHLRNTQVMFDTSLALRYGAAPLPQMSNPSDTLGKVPTKLYINGVLHELEGMKNVLSHIPPEDIAEMHYIDCWDNTVPLMFRNALFVNLKPGKNY
jgi:hypothetical protein